MLRRLLIRISAVVITLLLGTLISATLVRLAPGFDSDESKLDSRLSAETVAALSANKQSQHNLALFYVTYFRKALGGDFGNSSALGKPVRELIGERLPQTLRTCGLGLVAGCMFGFLLAFATATFRSLVPGLLTGATAGILLCVPAAVIALATVYANAPAGIAIAAIIFPKVYRYSRNLVGRVYEMPHVLTAVAKGVGPLRLLLCHVIPVCANQLAAVLGIAVTLALSAAIPIEALCGVPGIGQLAWQSALARDLPVLVTLTALVAAITILCNSVADILRSDARRVQA
jgi:ABC-type dipeptide/oligopeptide/nickel transport system permease component